MHLNSFCHEICIEILTVLRCVLKFLLACIKNLTLLEYVLEFLLKCIEILTVLQCIPSSAPTLGRYFCINS